jgi:hypothetical protein
VPDVRMSPCRRWAHQPRRPGVSDLRGGGVTDHLFALPSDTIKVTSDVAVTGAALALGPILGGGR